MNDQSTVKLIQMLTFILIPIIILIFVSIIILVVFLLKRKSKQTTNTNNVSKSNNSTKTTNKQPVFNFMEFDTIKDSMIIQKNGTKFLMVFECQGINYDLMSNIEKASVEEGFVQFLNTLRNQIQIYIQTRAVNLEKSLETYRKKVNAVETKLRNMQMQYKQMKDSGEYSDEQLKRAFFEVTKQSNLYEYGKSVLQDTERMNLNKNILNKRYYIVVPYYAAEAGNDNLGKSEIHEIAFSELYTRCQSLIRSLSTCGVRGKILRSTELAELLYMAYNRDEAETFGIDKAIEAGYSEMYSTAPDVLKKKMREIDKVIEENAIKLANEKVDQARSEIEQQVEEKEQNIDELIEQMAKEIIKENEQYIGRDVKEKAIEKIDGTEEGGIIDGKTKTRGRKKRTTV